MGKNSKKGKRTAKVVNTLLIVTGSALTNQGLKFLNKQDFMKGKDPSKPNYKPLIVAATLTAGAGAGAVFMDNAIVEAIANGVAAGAINPAIDEAVVVFGSGIKGVGSTDASVKKFMEVYTKSKGLNINGLQEQLK